MKKMLTLVVLISSVVYAASPFNPAVDDRFKKQERKQIRRDVLNISSTLAAGATEILGSLPEHAVVTQNYIIVETVPVSASDNTIAFGCDTSTDLLAARDFTDDSVNDIVAGVATGAAGSMVHMSSATSCDLTVTVGAGVTGITAGKLVFFTEYVVGE